MKYWMLLRIKIYKKIHMVRLQDNGESWYKVQGYITTAKNLMTRTMLVDTTLHTIFWSYTG